MTIIAVWRTAQTEVTTITTEEDVEKLLARVGSMPSFHPGIRVFLTSGDQCVEVAAGTELHQRVAAAATLQHQKTHTGS